MSVQVSDQMLRFVKDIRSRAHHAEWEFNRASDEIQRLSRDSINIYSSSATSQVADIVSKSKMACDKLYAEYQSLAILLDGECRPLLSEEPSLEAIREVRDLIAWLNEESKIENTFSASFGSNDYGQVAGVRYTPSAEALAAEGFWNAKYDAAPGRREEEARLRREAAEREQERKRIAEEKRNTAEAQYAAEKEAWNAKTEEVNATRERLLTEAMKGVREEIIRKFEAEHQAVTAAAEESIRQNTEQKKAAEQKLAGLGLFALGEKKQCKTTIDACNAAIAKAQLALRDADTKRAKSWETLSDAVEQVKKERKQQIEAQNPLPQRPKMNFTPKPGQYSVAEMNEYYKVCIHETLKEEGRLTITELMEKCPVCSDLSNQRVSAFMRQMTNEGRVERLDIKRVVYFEAR